MKLKMANLELKLAAGESCIDLLEEYPAISTRVYGGYFIKGAMNEQYRLTKGEELFLDTDEDNNANCFAVAVYRIKKGKKIKIGFLKDALASVLQSLSEFKCTVLHEFNREDGIGNTKQWGVQIKLLNQKRF